MNLTTTDGLEDKIKEYQKRCNENTWFAQRVMSPTLHKIAKEYTFSKSPVTLLFFKFNEGDWIEASENRNGRITYYVCKKCSEIAYKSLYNEEKKCYYRQYPVCDWGYSGQDIYKPLNGNDLISLFHYENQVRDVAKSIENANIGEVIIKVTEEDSSNLINTRLLDKSNMFKLDVMIIDKINITNVSLRGGYDNEAYYTVNKTDIIGNYFGEKELFQYFKEKRLNCIFTFEEKYKKRQETLKNQVKTDEGVDQKELEMRKQKELEMRRQKELERMKQEAYKKYVEKKKNKKPGFFKTIINAFAESK